MDIFFLSKSMLLASSVLKRVFLLFLLFFMFFLCFLLMPVSLICKDGFGGFDHVKLLINVCKSVCVCIYERVYAR